MGSIYYHLNTGLAATDYTNRLALLFFVLFFGISIHMFSIPLMFDERQLYYRERAASAYGVFAYWLSNIYLHFPLILINTLMFCAEINNLVELNGSFPYFWGVTYLCSVTGLTLAQFIVSISPNAIAAISLFILALFIVIAFAGFILFIPQFEYWLRCWSQYISFLRWGFQGLVLNEFDNNSNLPLSQIYIDNLGFDTYSKEYCSSVIMVSALVFSCLTLVALKIVNFENR